MREISQKVWSHRSVNPKNLHPVGAVRKSKPKLIRSYITLVKDVARIAYENPDFMLFFRGQRNHYENKVGETSLYPSLYRPDIGKDLRKETLKSRIEKLNRAVDLLLESKKIIIMEDSWRIRRFKEIAWAILQHYEVVATPLLDITQSLSFACRFALPDQNDQGEEADRFGYVYVLGCPNITEALSYFMREELSVIRLSTICPPRALRPHIQEAFSIGTVPLEIEKKSPEYDAARRLIAQFKIDGKFLTKYSFPLIPSEALFPDAHDLFKPICDEIKQKINH